MTTNTIAQAAPGLQQFHDESAWRGPEMLVRTDWRVELTANEVRELNEAADAAQRRGVDLVTMTERDVPLPLLGPRLRKIRRDVLHGRGFVLLRGWPSGEHSIERNAYAFRSVGAHLGEALSQNAKGHVLGHVANLGLDYSDPSTRGYQTSAELKFHTDGGDIVGLLCIRPSKTGGLSRICSSSAVWNEIVDRRPDLARVLMQPYSFSRVGEVRPGQQRYFKSAIFQPCAGRMITVLIHSFIQKAQAFEEVARLTQAQIDAIELIGTVGNDPSICLDMDFKPGDMQFLCNHSILHSRTAYEDWPEVEKRRHLLRLWISSEDGPELPHNIVTDFQNSTTTGRPDGIRIPGVPLVAPLQPA